jgi:AAA family ATP:ADP antiporter
MRPFAEIRAGEVPALVLLSLNGFLMMMSYYILKTVREPLILLGGTAGISGVELKTYATAAQAVLLLGLVPLYGYLASRANRLRLIRGTVAVLVGALVLFALLAALEAPIGIAYYLWLGMTSLIAGAQFWSFANDYYTRPQGERLFPILAAGGSLGAMAGAGTARWLIGQLGLSSLMLLSAALLALYAGVFSLVERLQHPVPGAAEEARRPLGGRGGFELVWKSRYLLLIGVMVMLANLVNTQGEYVFAHAVNDQAAQIVPAPVTAGLPSSDQLRALRDARRVVVGQLYSEFYGGVNLFGFLIQVLLVSRLFKYLGVHRAIYIFPLIALGTYGSMAAAPVFLLIAVAKTVENSADYSLHNTVRHALFLPTSRDAKYKGKAAIDSFFLRSGDLLAGAAVFAGNHVLALSVRSFALGNLALVGIWLLVVTVLSRHYQRLAAASDAGRPGGE